MAWIRWRTTKDGRRLAAIQWRDELGEVHSKALRTNNEAVAKTYLRAFERSQGARRNSPALKTALDALEAYLDEKRLGARPATLEICRARLEPLFRAWADVPMRHKTASMTMRYAHSTSERRRAAVGKILA